MMYKSVHYSQSDDYVRGSEPEHANDDVTEDHKRIRGKLFFFTKHQNCSKYCNNAAGAKVKSTSQGITNTPYKAIYFSCGSFVFLSCVSHAFASVHCCLVVTYWERADLLALVGDVYSNFVTFPCGILVSGVVLDCIVS